MLLAEDRRKVERTDAVKEKKALTAFESTSNWYMFVASLRDVMGGGIIVIYTDRLLLFSQPPHRHHYSYVFSALFKSEPVHCRSLATKIPICSHSDDRLHTATIHKHAAHTNTRRDVYEKVFGEKNSTPPAHPFTPRSLFTDNSPPSPYHSPLDLN